MTATTNETAAVAILLEAAKRVADKEGQRAEIMPGSVPVSLRIVGTVGKFQIDNSYQVTLDVAADETATPNTPYAEILADILDRLPEAQRACEFDRIRNGEFAKMKPAKQTSERLDEAAKAWRNAEKAANPKQKKGAVKATYSVTAATVATPKPTRQPAAAAQSEVAAAGNGSSSKGRRKAG